jgi:hypothetical protein
MKTIFAFFIGVMALSQASESFAARSPVYGECRLSSDRTNADIYIYNTLSYATILNGPVHVNYYTQSGYKTEVTEKNIHQTVNSRGKVTYSDYNLDGSANYCEVDLTDSFLPSTPLDLRVTNQDRTSLGVAWTPGTNNGDTTDYYIVAYSRTSNVLCESSTRVTTTQTSVTLTNLIQGSFYYIKVCSRGTYDGLAKSATLITSTTVDSSPEVKQLVAISSGLDAVSAKWVSGGGSTYDYVARIGLASNPPQNCQGGSVLTTPETVFSGLQPDTAYVVRVCSRNLNGMMTPGVTVDVSTQSFNTVLPFVDSFSLSNGPLSAAWSVVAGTFGIQNKIATPTSNGMSVAILRAQNVSNISLKIDLDLKDGEVENGAGLVARYSTVGSQTSMIIGRIRAKKSGGRVFFGEIVAISNGKETVLMSKRVKRRDASLELRLQGSQAVLIFDNDQVGTATVTNTAPGGMGILGLGDSEMIDNFSARAL